jgi:OmpA-OmpF porin, OOP family
MAKTNIFASIAFVLLCSAASAGEPAYKADEIVDMFIKSANLGEARAICVGTSDECAVRRETPADAVNMKINFEYNSAKLTPDAAVTIGEFAKAINDERLGVASFEVNGFTDAFGTDEFNMALSKRRAETVVETLVSLGVGADRIKSNGFGEANPASSDPFAPDNRRVEALIIMPKD